MPHALRGAAQPRRRVRVTARRGHPRQHLDRQGRADLVLEVALDPQCLLGSIDGIVAPAQVKVRDARNPQGVGLVPLLAVHVRHRDHVAARLEGVVESAVVGLRHAHLERCGQHRGRVADGAVNGNGITEQSDGVVGAAGEHGVIPAQWSACARSRSSPSAVAIAVHSSRCSRAASRSPWISAVHAVTHSTSPRSRVGSVSRSSIRSSRVLPSDRLPPAIQWYRSERPVPRPPPAASRRAAPSPGRPRGWGGRSAVPRGSRIVLARTSRATTGGHAPNNVEMSPIQLVALPAQLEELGSYSRTVISCE